MKNESLSLRIYQAQECIKRGALGETLARTVMLGSRHLANRVLRSCSPETVNIS